jgi:hypothetical protein
MAVVWAITKFFLAVFVVCFAVYVIFIMIKGEAPAELNKDVELIKSMFK